MLDELPDDLLFRVLDEGQVLVKARRVSRRFRQVYDLISRTLTIHCSSLQKRKKSLDTFLARLRSLRKVTVIIHSEDDWNPRETRKAISSLVKAKKDLQTLQIKQDDGYYAWREVLEVVRKGLTRAFLKNLSLFELELNSEIAVPKVYVHNNKEQLELELRICCPYDDAEVTGKLLGLLRDVLCDCGWFACLTLRRHAMLAGCLLSLDGMDGNVRESRKTRLKLYLYCENYHSLKDHGTAETARTLSDFVEKYLYLGSESEIELMLSLPDTRAGTFMAFMRPLAPYVTSVSLEYRYSIRREDGVAPIEYPKLRSMTFADGSGYGELEDFLEFFVSSCRHMPQLACVEVASLNGHSEEESLDYIKSIEAIRRLNCDVVVVPYEKLQPVGGVDVKRS